MPARRAHSGWLELGGMALAYSAYFGVRAFTQGDAARAVANAAELLRLEHGLALDWEHRIQGFVLGNAALLDAANAVYVWGHWPVLVAAGCLLFHLRPTAYARFRNALLLSGALGLVVFALFPVAPPRLASVGFLDTLRVRSGTDPTLFGPSLVNEYAALPSFHVGWSLLLAIELCRTMRRPLLRGGVFAMPVMMAFAVVATANHFILDVVAGSATAAVALLVLERVGTRPQGGDDMTAVRKDIAATVRGKPAGLTVARPDVVHAPAIETAAMFAAPTTYHSGSRVVEVLPGESHSAAWQYVTIGAPPPQRYRCKWSEDGGMVRRRDHASRHRHPRRRRGIAGAA